MIKPEDLQQGDVLLWHYNGDTDIHDAEFIIHYKDAWYFLDIEDSDVYRITQEDFDDCIINNVTSWKRDGVELLKPEETEQEEFVFCPIEKNQFGFFMIIMDQFFNGEKRVYPLDDGIHIGSAIKDSKGNSTYTFIGYSVCKNRTGMPFAESPVDFFSKDPEVHPYAVFMLTSKLEVGGR
jgi:hypothetical protein